MIRIVFGAAQFVAHLAFLVYVFGTQGDAGSPIMLCTLVGLALCCLQVWP